MLFLNEDIDRGPILYRVSLDPPIQKNYMDHQFDGCIRAYALFKTMEAYSKNKSWQYFDPSEIKNHYFKYTQS